MPNRPPRLEQVFQKYDPPLYFVTFNTDHRRHLLANERVHQRFIAFGETGLSRGAAIGRYVIMPDHIHLFVRGSLDFVLAQWVRILKRSLSAEFPTRPRIGNLVSSTISFATAKVTRKNGNTSFGIQCGPGSLKTARNGRGKVRSKDSKRS